MHFSIQRVHTPELKCIRFDLSSELIEGQAYLTLAWNRSPLFLSGSYVQGWKLIFFSPKRDKSEELQMAWKLCTTSVMYNACGTVGKPPPPPDPKEPAAVRQAPTECGAASVLISPVMSVYVLKLERKSNVDSFGFKQKASWIKVKTPGF